MLATVRACLRNSASIPAIAFERSGSLWPPTAQSCKFTSSTTKSMFESVKQSFRDCGVSEVSARSLQQDCRKTSAPLFRRCVHSGSAGKGPEAASVVGETSTSIASKGLMASILAFPKAQPFAFNILVATVKTSIADIITQCAIEQKTEIDWKRNGVFVVFGATYLGGFQYWLQVNMFRRWFPTMDRFANQSFSAKLRDTAGLVDTGKQVLFDVLVHLPFMYFPTFYAVKESVMGSSWSPADWVVDGCTKYYNNFRKDFTAMFSLWFPADCVIFAVPIWLRLPVRHVVSLGWTSYLSFLRGKKEPAPAAQGE
uniref:Protein Mpv17 n=1 Tax=Tetraselmis sp. GSL018 TaxID=582737 RepID=A0A061QQK7_9CHLO|mmetsp:Transcript_31064/g.73843  ORF Transcript_31064/g.73843 Transcript_31064/m.73843 type:complete len:312 (+) Transcript_31064:157-1092(+)